MSVSRDVALPYERPKTPAREEGLPAAPGRRDFLTQIGAASCALTGLGGAGCVLDCLHTKAALEPPTKIMVGRRERFPAGRVLLEREKKVVIVGTPNGVYAMSAVCPHLGCITRLGADGGLIECACHGSAFNLKGEVLSGPSTPLLWLDVQVNGRNELVVDTSAIVPAGKLLEG